MNTDRDRARDALNSTVIGVLASAPALLLATTDLTRASVLLASVVAASALARACAAWWMPNARRGYVFSRLLSVRYLVPALGLPLGAAFAIAAWSAWGVAITLAIHVALAWRYRVRWTRPGAVRAMLLPAVVGGFFCALERLALSGDEWRGGGRLLYAEESPLQRVVLLERGGSIELLLDGELQFRSADERLYHSALLDRALALLGDGSHVMVMGGGDGLAARDLLRCDRVADVTIVDWDPAVTRLFRTEPQLRALNADALADPKVRVVHRDIRSVLAERGERFDLVVGDLTDPNPLDPRSTALCSSEFYAAIKQRMSDRGALVTHASSLDGAWAARAIPEALEAAGFSTESYACAVPAFDTVTYVLGILPAGAAS